LSRFKRFTFFFFRFFFRFAFWFCFVLYRVSSHSIAAIVFHRSIFDVSYTSADAFEIIAHLSHLPTSLSGRCPDPAANSRPSTRSTVLRFSHSRCALAISYSHTCSTQVEACAQKGANAGPLSKSKFATEFYEETGTWAPATLLTSRIKSRSPGRRGLIMSRQRKNGYAIPLELRGG
jgi:hypothetical protein